MSRNLLRRFDQFRRRHTDRLNAWLYTLLGRDHFLSDERLRPEQIKRILVVRNNKRIGNMYFLLPFLNAVKQAYPDAVLDLMVIAPSQTKVFEGLPIARIWVSQFAFGTGFQFIKTMLACRKQPYDLLLMPHPSSSDRIIGGLIHARNKVSFADPETNRVYRHSIKVQSPSPHAALTPLSLLEHLTNAKLAVDHTLTFQPAELEAARHEITLLRQQSGNSEGLCVAYFRGARGTKIIADHDWLAIRQKFDAAAFDMANKLPILWVEILSPDIAKPLTSTTTTWQSKDFRKLAALLATCDLFVCGDTGPLHLADAAGARCVGLFTATKPEHYGCMGKACWNITDLHAMNAQAILMSIPSVTTGPAAP